jgi:transcriptional regulator with GAF, ATPase, and Fis domain
MEHREEWLARTLVELADTLIADFDLIDLISMLVERCAELLDTSEVGLVLADVRGDLRVLASSSERMRVLELIEVQNDEGPCRDSFRHGELVLNQRLDRSEDRWPRFAPKARVAGFQMVHAVPLRLRAEIIGAMSIFSADDHELTALDVNLTRALADMATIGILQERALAQGTQLASQLQGALNSRVVIEQAKGIVAEELNVGMDDAFAVLQNYARRGRHRLSKVALSLTDRTLTARDLLPAESSNPQITSRNVGGL